MPWQTTFVCEDVKFSTDEHPGLPCSDTCDCNDWTYVRISVQDLGVETPWLLVEEPSAKGSSQPVMFRAMRDSWKISFDEHTMTITMQAHEVETLTSGNHKLRFNRATDFWSLLYQITLSRLRDYTAQQVIEAHTTVAQEEIEY